MTLARTLLVPVCLMACGPVVEVDSSATTAEGTTEISTSEPSVDATTSGSQPSCTAGDAKACSCPNGRTGSQTCMSNGAFGACTCPDSDSSTDSGATGGTGDSSASAESSTGASQPTECPEDPVLCLGWVTVTSDAELTDASMCTTVDGSLWLEGTVSDISSLGCITSIEELRIESTALTDLSGLARLERLGTLEIVGAPALEQLDLPVLTTLERLTVTDNPALGQFGLPALTEVTWNVHVTENPNLSNCEVEALLDQVGGAGGNVCYASNARDACLPFCP